jgi:hypothetical protein
MLKISKFSSCYPSHLQRGERHAVEGGLAGGGIAGGHAAHATQAASRQPLRQLFEQVADLRGAVFMRTKSELS